MSLPEKKRPRNWQPLFDPEATAQVQAELEEIWQLVLKKFLFEHNYTFEIAQARQERERMFITGRTTTPEKDREIGYYDALGWGYSHYTLAALRQVGELATQKISEQVPTEPEPEVEPVAEPVQV